MFRLFFPQMEILKSTIQDMEKERDFYFGKLRNIELICQEKEGEGDPTLQRIIDILYATDVSSSDYEREQNLYFWDVLKELRLQREPMGWHVVVSRCFSVEDKDLKTLSPSFIQTLSACHRTCPELSSGLKPICFAANSCCWWNDTQLAHWCRNFSPCGICTAWGVPFSWAFAKSLLKKHEIWYMTHDVMKLTIKVICSFFQNGIIV